MVLGFPGLIVCSMMVRGFRLVRGFWGFVLGYFLWVGVMFASCVLAFAVFWVCEFVLVLCVSWYFRGWCYRRCGFRLYWLL